MFSEGWGFKKLKQNRGGNFFSFFIFIKNNTDRTSITGKCDYALHRSSAKL